MNKNFKALSYKFAEPVEGKIPEDIQLLKVGVFSYMAPGDMVISKEMFASMIVNFQNNVRGIDLAVDYGHECYEEAAGWISDVYMNETQDELWAKVVWTNEATEKIKDKQYRYISAEFCTAYCNDKNVECGPTLFGAALTNRPFLKDMQCVVDMNEKLNQEKIKMDEIKKLNEKVAEVETKLSESTKLLAEKDTTIEKLKADIVLNEKKAIEEKKTFTFNEMLKDGKVVEAQRKSYMENDVVAFSQLSQPINLAAKGSSVDSPAPIADVQLEIKRLAEIKMSEKKLSWRDAVKEVLSENKELAEKYSA